MKIFIGQPRLQVYEILIGNYDLCDKYKFSFSKFKKVKSIVIHNIINKIINENLSLLFFKEFIAKQCSNIYKSRKLGFLKKFVTTLRKAFLYFYLEILLSFFLLKNKPRITTSIDCQYINLILGFNINNFSTRHLSEKLKFLNFLFKFSLKL